jgi:hypothetical protein
VNHRVDPGDRASEAVAGCKIADDPLDVRVVARAARQDAHSMVLSF